MAKKSSWRASNEEFDDLEEIKVEKGKLCSYTEGFIDFEQHQPQKGQVLLHQDTDFLPPSSPLLEGAHKWFLRRKFLRYEENVQSMSRTVTTDTSWYGTVDYGVWLCHNGVQ